MPTCTGCKLTTNMSYDIPTFQGPVTNITSSGPGVLLHSHVVQGVGINELSGITGFPLGWVNIYLDNPSNGSCVGVTGRLTLPTITSGQFVTGSSGISYNGSVQYCTGDVVGCQSNKIHFQFSGNPDIYKAAPGGITAVTSIASYQNINSTSPVTPYLKYHTPSGLSVSNQNVTGTLTEDFVRLDCGGTARAQLMFDAYVPNVLGQLKASYYYYLNCTYCQTGIGGA